VSNGTILLGSGKSLHWPARFDMHTGTLKRPPGGLAFDEPDGPVITFLGKPCSETARAYGYELLCGRQMFCPEGELYPKGWEAHNPRTYYFVRSDDAGREVWIAPFALTTTMPAWDDSLFFTAVQNDCQLHAFTPAQLIARLDLVASGQDTRCQTTAFGAKVLHTVTDPVYNSSAPQAYDDAQWGPIHGEALAMALSANLAIACVSNKFQSADIATEVVKDTAAPDLARPWFARALDRSDGALVWEHRLPAMPRLNSICVTRSGRVVVVLHTGALVCLGATELPVSRDAIERSTWHNGGTGSKAGRKEL
jgi:hypothetical protein